jgi:hypothetical protein
MAAHLTEKQSSVNPNFGLDESFGAPEYAPAAAAPAFSPGAVCPG